MISFFTHGGRSSGTPIRGHHESLGADHDRRQHEAVSGYVVAQGSDDTTKESNLACAADVVK